MADEHFSRVSLERFFRSELSRQEARDVVRHLLRRCPKCHALLRHVANGESFQLLLRGLEDAALLSDPDPVEPVLAKVSLFSRRREPADLAEAKRRGRVVRS
jgi:anti-sigma factor RsiW